MSFAFTPWLIKKLHCFNITMAFGETIRAPRSFFSMITLVLLAIHSIYGIINSPRAHDSTMSVQSCHCTVFHSFTLVCGYLI